jgi:hypothetical protein
MSWLRRKLAGARPAAEGAAEGGSVGAPGPGVPTGVDQRISTVRGVGFRFETD